ncbi:HNH endonuclease [Archangium violaceum]|uniref:HNH endonuclease n=1 Tax=Archangium violaceum TaxID=83451 RepID=UPI00193C806A|nr:HNH endonuclease [Archangium violaceum]QRK10989.1 HNH endonuclease [Archangium violaceum]
MKSRGTNQGKKLPWSDKENAAAVDAYFQLLRAEEAGQKLSKAQFIRALRSGTGPLPRRSRSAIEMKFQNISALLAEHGLPWVKGYAPLAHVQETLWPHIERALADDLMPTADPEELQRKTRRLRLRGGPLAPPKGNLKPPRVKVRQQTAFERDPAVRAYVLQQADGKCELCEKVAPFETEEGEPYLEVHHVRRLALGGSDRPENTVALCPTCHRWLHHGADAERLRRRLYARVQRLVEE